MSGWCRQTIRPCAPTEPAFVSAPLRGANNFLHGTRLALTVAGEAACGSERRIWKTEPGERSGL